MTRTVASILTGLALVTLTGCQAQPWDVPRPSYTVPGQTVPYVPTVPVTPHHDGGHTYVPLPHVGDGYCRVCHLGHHHRW